MGLCYSGSFMGVVEKRKFFFLPKIEMWDFSGMEMKNFIGASALSVDP